MKGSNKGNIIFKFIISFGQKLIFGGKYFGLEGSWYKKDEINCRG